jgi:hypothetical protein
MQPEGMPDGSQGVERSDTPGNPSKETSHPEGVAEFRHAVANIGVLTRHPMPTPWREKHTESKSSFAYKIRGWMTFCAFINDSQSASYQHASQPGSGNSGNSPQRHRYLRPCSCSQSQSSHAWRSSPSRPPPPMRYGARWQSRDSGSDTALGRLVLLGRRGQDVPHPDQSGRSALPAHSISYRSQSWNINVLSGVLPSGGHPSWYC